jgi:PAS domain S-box-containing protein
LLRQTQQRLVDRESRLAAVVEASPDGVLTLSDRAQIESANRAARQLLGATGLELLGWPVERVLVNFWTSAEPIQEPHRFEPPRRSPGRTGRTVRCTSR